MLRPASACAVHRRMLIGRSLPSQPAFPGTVPVPTVHPPSRRQPARDASRYSASLPVLSGPGKRSARGSARRRCARSKHPWPGCKYAPRPGNRACGSGTTSSPAATRRSRSDLTARTPHPTHIRIAGAGRTGRGDRLAISAAKLTVPASPRYLARCPLTWHRPSAGQLPPPRRDALTPCQHRAIRRWRDRAPQCPCPARRPG